VSALVSSSMTETDRSRRSPNNREVGLFLCRSRNYVRTILHNPSNIPDISWVRGNETHTPHATFKISSPPCSSHRVHLSIHWTCVLLNPFTAIRLRLQYSLQPRHRNDSQHNVDRVLASLIDVLHPSISLQAKIIQTKFRRHCSRFDIFDNGSHCL